MVASAIQGLALRRSRTVSASRNSSDERPLTPPIASTSSWLSCLRPLMPTVVMRKPAALASALRVSRSAGGEFIDMAALTMPKPSAAEQDRSGSGRADAARQVTLDQKDETVGRLAVDHRRPFRGTLAALGRARRRHIRAAASPLQ